MSAGQDTAAIASRQGSALPGGEEPVAVPKVQNLAVVAEQRGLVAAGAEELIDLFDAEGPSILSIPPALRLCGRRGGP